jgi:hypothetical protein
MTRSTPAPAQIAVTGRTPVVPVQLTVHGVAQQRTSLHRDALVAGSGEPPDRTKGDPDNEEVTGSPKSLGRLATRRGRGGRAGCGR